MLGGEARYPDWRMYYPQNPKEPSGCMQTIMVTRAILGILAVPIGLIFGLMILITTAFVALSVSPFLALGVVALGLLIAGAIIRWERKRVDRDFPTMED